MSSQIILSHFQVGPLLEAYRQGLTAALTSTDLGMTAVEASLTTAGAVLPGGQRIPWEALQKIWETPHGCFTFEEGRLEKIQRFSAATNRFCSLYATESAPTLVLAGFPMHRIKDTNPYQDTLGKIRAIQPVTGRVLDTTTGLGYTAIQASKTAEQVITIELDPAVLEIARLNPWSQALFNHPKITQIVGDAFDEIRKMPESSFDRVIHDPPTFSLAGELYSLEFYRQIWRVLRRGGRLFHYIGDLNSKLGQKVQRGVIRRLAEAGFGRIRPDYPSFGIVAEK